MKTFILVLVFSASLVLGQADQNWLDECLAAHNEFRAEKGKPPLVLNRTLTQIAQSWADELSSSCGFDHSNNENLGENLAGGSNDCRASVKQWTDEEQLYDPSNPVYSKDTAHYTQVVWKATTDLGCGIAPHCEYEFVTVCNYWPPGNYDGQFEQNV